MRSSMTQLPSARPTGAPMRKAQPSPWPTRERLGTVARHASPDAKSWPNAAKVWSTVNPRNAMKRGFASSSNPAAHQSAIITATPNKGAPRLVAVLKRTAGLVLTWRLSIDAIVTTSIAPGARTGSIGRRSGPRPIRGSAPVPSSRSGNPPDLRRRSWDRDLSGRSYRLRPPFCS